MTQPVEAAVLGLDHAGTTRGLAKTDFWASLSEFLTQVWMGLKCSNKFSVDTDAAGLGTARRTAGSAVTWSAAERAQTGFQSVTCAARRASTPSHSRSVNEASVKFLERRSMGS